MHENMCFYIVIPEHKRFACYLYGFTYSICFLCMVLKTILETLCAVYISENVC